MKKILGLLIGVLILHGASNPFATTQAQALGAIQQWLADFMQAKQYQRFFLYPPTSDLPSSLDDYPTYGTSCPKDQPHCHKITTLLLSAYGEFYKDYQVQAKGMCLGIIKPSSALEKGFCLKDFTEPRFEDTPKQGIRLIKLAMLRFIPPTLTSQAQHKPVVLEFRIVSEERFYLYRFREFKGWWRSDYYDFYDQLRDDPKDPYKYPLEAVTNQLLEHFKTMPRIFAFKGEALQNSIDYLEGTPYTLVRSTPKPHSKLGDLVCLSILHQQQIIGRSLCLEGYQQGGFAHQGDLLKLEFSRQYSNILQKLTITLKLQKGQFWLDRLSGQTLRTDTQTGVSELLESPLFYDQNQEDFKHRAPISFKKFTQMWQKNQPR
ncbi:hypothetical protein [Helicobacter mehlei]|uniref:hypothetical protein n=1 Tax=Helicobacter mehlei TaxID=2316080 RepID=UPI000EB30F1E|nr:hypothetical protein [Helicobacter mehlei]